MVDLHTDTEHHHVHHIPSGLATRPKDSRQTMAQNRLWEEVVLVVDWLLVAVWFTLVFCIVMCVWAYLGEDWDMFATFYVGVALLSPATLTPFLGRYLAFYIGSILITAPFAEELWKLTSQNKGVKHLAAFIILYGLAVALLTYIDLIVAYPASSLFAYEIPEFDSGALLRVALLTEIMVLVIAIGGIVYLKWRGGLRA